MTGHGTADRQPGTTKLDADMTTMTTASTSLLATMPDPGQPIYVLPVRGVGHRVGLPAGGAKA